MAGRKHHEKTGRNHESEKKRVIRMKKNILLACLLILVFQACVVQSINRFYTDDLLIESNALDGQWKLIQDYQGDVSGDDIAPWIFSKDKLTVIDEKKRKSSLEVHLFKIGDTILLDAMAESPENECAYYVFAIAPKHILFKVEMNKDQNRITILPLNYKWFEKKIADSDKSLKFVKAEEDYDVPLFTFTPAEWVSYLKANMNQEGFFSTEDRLVLQKVES
jgi:hypothetical protein